MLPGVQGQLLSLCQAFSRIWGLHWERGVPPICEPSWLPQPEQQLLVAPEGPCTWGHRGNLRVPPMSPGMGSL